MTISDKLQTIKNSLDNIKASIVNKGQTPSGDITTYATAIDNIQAGIDAKSMCEKTLTTINIPPDTTIIKDYAFSGCDNISIVAENDLEIEPFAFSGTTGTIVTPQGTYTLNSGKPKVEKISNREFIYRIDNGVELPISLDIIEEAGKSGSYITVYVGEYRLVYAYYAYMSDRICIIDNGNNEFFIDYFDNGATALFVFGVDWDNMNILLEDAPSTINSIACISSDDILYLNNNLAPVNNENNTIYPIIVQKESYSTSNTFNLYNKDYIPYSKSNFYVKPNENIIVYNPRKKDGYKIQIIPDKEVNKINLSYDLVTFESDYCTVTPNTQVKYVIDSDYKLVEETVVVNENTIINVELQPSVVENVVLNGTFDSSSYSKNYMENATIENVSITDNAITCTSTDIFSRSYGYIKFVTPASGGTISVTANIDLSATSTSNWSGGEVILSEELYDVTYMSFVNTSATDKHLFFTRASSLESATVTRELEGHKTYYLCFGTGKYSGSNSNVTLYITNISFTAEK